MKAARKGRLKNAHTPIAGSVFLLCLGLYSQASFASILPKNNLHLQDNLYLSADITETEFNTIVNDIVTRYKPVVARHGGILSSRNRWTDPTVNASAQQDGNSWVLNMYGGLARRPELTKDAFSLVVCHELGHHLGGFSFYGNENSEWASSEGQADYFATHSCAKEIWGEKTTENAQFRSVVGAFEKQKCDNAWSSTADQNLCYRVAEAGQSLATLLSALRSGDAPQFNTPDHAVVTKTFTGHPDAQCRLDTYLAGALCNVPFLKDLIPGREHPLGQDSPAAEETASLTSCTTAAGFEYGNRPLCWFKPKVDYLGITYGQKILRERDGNGNGVAEPGETLELIYTLGNLARNVTNGVTASISTNHSAIETLQETTTFPDISPKSREAQQSPFLLKIADDAQCGSSFDVTLQARSPQGQREFKESFVIGKLVNMLQGSNAKPQEIPDDSSTGIESIIHVAQNSHIRGVTVALDISHTYSGDLSIDLTAPGGVKKNLLQRDGGSSDGVNKSITLDWPTTTTAGDWTLSVKDLSSSDKGTLNKWSLTFSEAVCAPRNATLTQNRRPRAFR